MTSIRHTTASSTASLLARFQAQPVDTMNHELRTPLTTLVGHTELLQDLDLPEAAGHSIDAMVRAVERLLRLATTFSQVAELDRAAHGVTPGGIGLSPLPPLARAGRCHA